MTEQDGERAADEARDDVDAGDEQERESGGSERSDADGSGRVESDAAGSSGGGPAESDDEPRGQRVVDVDPDEENVDLDEVDVDLDEVDDALVERVAESDPEAVARELAALRVRVEGLEGQLAAREDEVDDLTEKLARKQADVQNFKKRMEKRREQEKRRATEDLVGRLLDVRDNLVRALDQDDADADAIRSGVETTLSQFDRVLDDENVDVVDPDPGDEVDPHTHEVLMRVEADQPADTIADVHRPGYVMADKVLQTAQVTVSEGNDGRGESDERGESEPGDGSNSNAETEASGE